MHIFNRQCFFSDASASKNRPLWFSRAANFLSLEREKGGDDVLHIIYDAAKGPWASHWLSPLVTEKDAKLAVMNSAGSEAKAFLILLDYIYSLNIDDEELIYIVEDDYLHKNGWKKALYDAFCSTPCHYATLYDHPDKYCDYPNLTSRIFTGYKSHWRTTPSTTNTFACRMRTLREDEKLLRDYSTGVNVSRDHERFIALGQKNRVLVSPIPSFSTHVESDNLAPFWND